MSTKAVLIALGKISYIDMQGKPIAMEDNRTAPSIQVASTGYGRCAWSSHSSRRSSARRC